MQIEKDYRFGVHGADSKGTVTSTTGGVISYRYDHAPEIIYTMIHKDFVKISFAIEQGALITA